MIPVMRATRPARLPPDRRRPRPRADTLPTTAAFVSERTLDQGTCMSTYRGVDYQLRWTGRWEWVIFQQPGHSVGICEGRLECSLSPDDWRALAEASVRTEIEMLLERGLVDGEGLDHGQPGTAATKA
jgi:hypothetical protein